MDAASVKPSPTPMHQACGRHVFLSASGPLIPHVNHSVRGDVDDSCRWLRVYYVLGSLLKMLPALSHLSSNPLGGKNHHHTHSTGEETEASGGVTCSRDTAVFLLEFKRTDV